MQCGVETAQRQEFMVVAHLDDSPLASSTMILSAPSTVDNRCAITSVVLPS
jgi:hypothetical protein